jgi:protein TonB
MTGLATEERVATKEQTALFTMIEPQSFVARLVSIVRLAATEFAQNPRAYLHDIFAGEKKDSQRSRRIRAGLILALVGHILIGGLLAILSRHSVVLEKANEEPKEIVTMLPPMPTPVKTEKIPNAIKSDSVLPPVPVTSRGQLDKGGGGGGQEGAQEQPQAGPPKQSLPIPSVVASDSQPMLNPSMPAPSNIEGPEAPPPPPDANTGANGKNGNSGTEAGAGGGKNGGRGTGDGPGSGPGTGPGNNGGKGGGDYGIPNGGIIPMSRLSGIPDSRPITWIYRPTPVTTPEAQAKRVVGEVLLRATFRSDGTITDIDVIHEVDFMTDSAKEALKRSKFRPATIKGEPVTVTGVIVRINVHY